MAAPVNASSIEPFQTLQDPRMERTKKHNRLDILVIAVGPLLTGGAGFQDMALLGQSKRTGLQTFRAWLHGLPSHATFGRGFARLNPRRLLACLLAWTRAVAPLTQGALVSLDGQTVQASCDRATASSLWFLVFAWCSAQGGLVMGYIKTDQQSHESTTIPALLPL